jgi:predicted cupin superfamily sugar epimerase
LRSGRFLGGARGNEDGEREETERDRCAPDVSGGQGHAADVSDLADRVNPRAETERTVYRCRSRAGVERDGVDAASAWKRELGLEPIPEEGGWFRRTAEGRAGPDGRAAWSSIVALFTVDGFSALHRIDCDELWTWIAGDPLRCVTIDARGDLLEQVLGPSADDGTRLQWSVPAGAWQAAQPRGAEGWTLVSCVCVPGYVSEGFELGRRAAFELAYPKLGALVREFTRGDSDGVTDSSRPPA